MYGVCCVVECMFGCRADTAVMLIVDLTKADACELAAIRLAHLAKHGAGDYILYILFSVVQTESSYRTKLHWKSLLRD